MITGTLLQSPLPTLVPNRFPLIPPGECRLAVIGEAPGEDELRGTDSRGNPAPEPFIGVSGRFLRALLGNAGLACDQLFFGNICQHNPPHNEIEKFEWEGPEIQGGLSKLREDLRTFAPNCVLLLGRTAFRAFRADLCPQGKKGVHIPLNDWRGSIYGGTGDFAGFKCIASYHPAYILRQYADIPFLRFDITRAARQGTFPELRVKARTGILRPQPEEILSFLQEVSRSLSPLTLDIEGYADDVGVTMLSLCTSEVHGIVIPFWIDSRNYFSEEDEVLVWQTLALVLADPRIPKTAHNAFYELFVLAWRHRIIINNLHDDTMMKHWEVFPEAGGDADDDDTGDRKRQGLGRDLGTCTSIYTEHPFYKADRLSHDSEVKLQYNLTDSLVTHEINAATETILASRPASYQHYRFNINLIPAYNYIMLRGCKFDVGRAASLAETTAGELSILQRELDGTLVPLAEAAGVLKRKRKSDPYTFNVKSPKQKAWYLYDYLGCKPLVRWGRTTKEVTLFHYLGKTHDPTLRLLIRAVRKRTRISDIHKLLANADGRIRSSFDPVGTNTGRLSSRESTALELIAGEWTNTGTNLQNVTKELRACFIPDSPDFAFWQCDLKGADGWTVAADLAALGYPAMLEDYNAGISPAVVLYYMLQEHAAGRNPGAVNTIPRHELKTLLKTLKRTIDSLDGQVDTQGRPLDWQYLCCKRIQHGCVTAGHEVLTRNGWVAIENLPTDIEILNCDKEGKASWGVPVYYTDKHYSGDMVTLDGESLYIDMTADHKVLYNNGRDNMETCAIDLIGRSAARIPKSSNIYSGALPSENLIRLLAAYQADGCQREDGQIAFHLKKERKISRLKALLEEGGFAYKLYTGTDETVQIQFTSCHLSSFGKNTDWRMLKLNAKAMRWYLEESVHWDGSQQESYCHKRTELFSADFLRVEVMHTMAHLCGMSGQLYKEHRTSGFGTRMFSCSLNNRTNARVTNLKRNVRKVENLRVFCVTTTTGFFFIRSHGHVHITGNSNYGAAPEKISEVIFGDSDGTINLSKKDATLYQQFYKLRYQTDHRNLWIRKQLTKDGALTAACGIRRQFFNIRNRYDIDDAVVREASAFEPQANTTWATNKALERLWYDPSNRQSTGALHVEPLLQIHDALAGQFRLRDREWATRKLAEWFQNPIRIHGINITIPAPGNWGESWKDCHNAF